MDIRYSCNQRDFKRYTTEEIRKEFLIEKLFEADQVTAVYSHVDRLVTLGIMPVKAKVSIDQGIDIKTRAAGHHQSLVAFFKKPVDQIESLNFIFAGCI